MSFELDTLERFFKSLSTDSVDFRVFREAERDGIRLSMVSQVSVSNRDMIMKKHEAVTDQLVNLRETILNSKLFEYEQKQLEKYQELKNMKFVIDGLKELDFDKIKEKEFRGYQEFYLRG